MCHLCRAFGSEYADKFHSDPFQLAGGNGTYGYSGPAPAYATTIGIGATGDKNVDGLLSGYRWSGTVTFSFPDSASDYPSGYGYGEPAASGFAQISAAQQAAVHRIMARIESLTSLDIEYAGTNSADIRIAQSSAANPTAYAYYPNSAYSEGGDVWFGTYYNYANPKLGDYYYLTHLHEIGHAFGLKHGQTNDGVAGTALPVDRDALEFSVMTYRSYVGGPTTGYTNEAFGYPQSFMMNDILALQTMYGADYSFNSGATVYSWSPTTGETFVNGEGQGRPGGDSASASANRVFITIWDGGGEDTYDLSNYTNAVTIDLRPGFWSVTSAVQKAYLGDGQYAKGNVYNAYLFNGDPRSYIENAIGGSGNDTLRGNAVANRLDGGPGNDTLTGDAGDDVFVYRFGGGADVITDFVAGADTVDRIDLIGFSGISSFAQAIAYASQVGNDTVFNFGTGSTLTLLNVLLAALSSDDFTFDVVPAGPNEAPTDIVLANDTITENAAGAFVGALSVSDPNDDVAFTFVVSDPRFEVVGTPGNYQLKLKSGISLDFESEPSIALSVTATDTGDLSIVETFTINVLDEQGVIIYGTVSGDTIDATRTPAGQSRPTAENDVIYGMAGGDTIRGLGGNDTIDGGEGNDTLYGGEGNDVLAGGAGADRVYGDAGNDTFVVVGSEAVNDSFSGGAGTDRLLVAGAGHLSLAGFNAAAVSIEIWEGNGAALLGTSSANTFNLAGLVAVNGLAYVDAGAGNDVITGSMFADDLRGGSGNDTIYGGEGGDILSGDAGTDRLYGEAGDDTFVVAGSDALNDTFSGGSGTDRILVTGTNNLSLAAFAASAASIEIWQGNGAALLGTGAANTFDLSGLTALSGLSYIDGGKGNDTLVGSIFADDLRGGADNDMIYGGEGDDILSGGTGTDRLYGEAGEDTFIVTGTEAVNDVFSGGEGIDRIIVIGTAGLTLAGFNAAAASVEIWQGNGAALLGTTAANTFDLSGLTSVSGLSYVDVGSGNDVIIGSSFADDLRGGSGSDVLDGGVGDDILRGGAGNDTMRGDEGADRFVFANSGSSHRDMILDYTFADGDVIDLSALLDAAFGPSSNVADFVRLAVSGNNILVQVDANGLLGGVSWSDVAVLSGGATLGVDQVLVYFEQQTQILTA